MCAEKRMTAADLENRQDGHLQYLLLLNKTPESGDQLIHVKPLCFFVCFFVCFLFLFCAVLKIYNDMDHAVYSVSDLTIEVVRCLLQTLLCMLWKLCTCKYPLKMCSCEHRAEVQ